MVFKTANFWETLGRRRLSCTSGKNEEKTRYSYKPETISVVDPLEKFRIHIVEQRGNNGL